MNKKPLYKRVWSWFAENWRSPRKKFRVLALASLAGVLAACVNVSRTIVAPPEIPGATFVGSETCSQCHEDKTKGFHTATHGKLVAKGKNAENLGCESCHGPGSVHNQTGGARGTIVNPKRSPETCFQCHLDKRGEFQLTSHHPVLEGKVTCGDCHDAHKGPAVRGGGVALATERDTCGKCHQAQHGPFVFEHEALREGCTTCHKVHGSVNARLLTERNQNLCLKCHFQQQLAGGTMLIGGRDHKDFVRRGTCWSAGCHEAVHGSQIGSSLRF